MAERSHEYVTRLSVSLPNQLVKDLDATLSAKGYDSRSQAVADIVRDWLVEQRQQEKGRIITGTITLVYDHHKRDLHKALTDIQHDHHQIILATLHVHLDHDHCMEVIAVRGKSQVIRPLADALIAAKGVKHGKWTVSSVGGDLAG